jgi:hypothetical protein
MKSPLRWILPLLAICLIAAKSPEQQHHDVQPAMPQVVAAMPDSLLLPLESGLLQSEASVAQKESKLASDNLGSSISTRKGKSIARETSKAGKKHKWLLLLGGAVLVWSLGRRMRKRPGGKQRTQMASGIKIALGILLFLVFLAGGILGAAAIVGATIAMFWQVTLACMSGLITLILLGFGLFFLAKGLDIQLSFKGWIFGILVLLPLMVLAGLLIGSLVFLLYFNLFLPIAVGFFPAGAAMAEMLGTMLVGLGVINFLFND